MIYFKFLVFIFLIFIIYPFNIYAGNDKNTPKIATDETAFTNVGNIRMTESNFGTFGSAWANFPKQPSCEYPRGSGIEHLFLGGLWIGGIKNFGGNRVHSVSTGAIDIGSLPPGGLAEGFEFTTDSTSHLTTRSSLPTDPFYSPYAISHQDFLADFTDANLYLPGSVQKIPNHDYPLGVAVHSESYVWNYSFADFFVILNYTIKNVTTSQIDSLFVGVWTDMVVRNTLISNPIILKSNYYNTCGNSILDSLRMIYVYDISGDNGLADSYASTMILGTSPKIDSTYYNDWTFHGSTGDEWSQTPQDDDAKYRRMSSSFLNQITLDQAIQKIAKASNYIQLLSTGPFVRLNAGDSINVAFAVVCAKKHGKPSDNNDQTRSTLVSNASWAKRTYNGTDKNGNNKLDSNEVNLHGDGKIVRYILPTPPPSPTIQTIVEDSKVTLYWSDNAEKSVDIITNKKNFEGYRLYRSNPGEDLLNESTLHEAGTYDKLNDKIGLDNGFEAISIKDDKGNSTRLHFEGDTVGYTYKYVFDNLLNGWQYTFALTSFSDGDEASGLPALESSQLQSEIHVIPGTRPQSLGSVSEVGIYPNPYYTSAAWDAKGNVERGRKIYFYNLPAQATIRIYSISGDLVITLNHSAGINEGQNIEWFTQINGSSSKSPTFSGGQYAWDLLTDKDQAIAPGMYLVRVEDTKTSETKTGRFLILK